MKTPKVRSTVQVGNIEKISGEVNIAAGNIIKNIRTIYERSLTAAEEADKARLLENKLLAEGVSSYLQRLQQQTKRRQENTSPYKGLLEYRLEDAQTFFGRSTAIHDLLVTIDRGPLTVLHAESGAGKTSLLQAGIVPRILAHGHLPIYLRPYNKSPSQAIKLAFLPDLSQYPILAQVSLRDFLARVVKILGKQPTLFLMLDQFEEFFLHVEEKEQAAFVNELGECLDDKALNVRWLISLRSEYFGRLANFRPRIHNPYENDFLLNRLTREEACEAIILPARKYKIKFERGLVDKILNDLGTSQVAPPQLQLVCSALYEALTPNESLLTKKIYEVREGGTNGILHNHLERVLKRLKPDERVTARQVLEALVTSIQQRALRPRLELIHSLSARGFSEADLQNALDQLVEGRLLRVEESDDGPAYELAHDYLLDEIRLDPNVIKRKQAEELLNQGLSNWMRFQLLLAPDAIKIIQTHSDDLDISTDKAKLLFLSSVRNKMPSTQWKNYISLEEKKVLVKSLLKKKGRESNDALWALRRHLTLLEKPGVYTKKILSLILSIVSNEINLLFRSNLVRLLILSFLISLTFLTLTWTNVQSISSQCLNGHQPSHPLVAIDSRDGSHVVIFDRGSGILCETGDTGARWKSVNTGLARNMTVKSIAINKYIYMLTDQGIVHQTQNPTWGNIDLPDKTQLSLREIAISPDQTTIYAVGGQDFIYAYDMIAHRWNRYPLKEVTGEITDVTVNSWYLAVSSTEGIWYQSINGKGGWENFEYRLDKQPTITSIGMYRIIPGWGGDIVNLQDSDRLLALTKVGELYSAYLTEERGLELLTAPPGLNPAENNLSLAVNQGSNFAADAANVFCKQSWTILNAEWWKYRLSMNRPCQ